VYMFVLGPYVRCGKIFSFNPERVPSMRLTPDGPREPICKECVEWANMLRKEEGAPEIVPLPGAYEPEEV